MKAGESLGPYEIVALLGAGGMGEVWRARDTRLGREVAVKVLPRELASDPDRLRRFEQEARASSALNHPNIVVVHDIGSHDGAPYLVEELLEGDTLRGRLEGGALPPRKAVEVAVQVCLGLAAAHDKGIVHRDLKPENLFVTTDGHVKILDFGLAKLGEPSPAPEKAAQASTRLGSTVSGAVLGTVGYMAPEQLRGQRVDERADIFAFGCVLHEMLSGRSPFLRETAPATAAAILHEDPAPLGGPGSAVPSAFQGLVRRCLEKRPEGRFSTAHDLALALGALLETLVGAPSAAVPVEKSIVVLPFENLSPDPENAYFADGLTEELIADLSKVRSLRVISRTSAMHYRGATKPLPVIAAELKVRYVLEGSVRRAGTSLRITAQLIDAASDAHLWAEKYGGSLDDVFAIQERVSRAIVDALRLELSPQEHRRMAERSIPSVYAYECYLKARREIWHFAEPSLDKAGAYLAEGLSVLPDNPLLLAGMGYVRFQRANLGLGQEDDLVQAESFASRALEIAPDLPEGHLVLGLVAACLRGEIREAIAHFDRALAEDPNNQDVLKWVGSIYTHVGRLAEAAAMGERVVAADPMSPMSYIPLMFSTWLDGRYDAALEVLDRARQADPGAVVLEPLRVLLLVPMGRRDEVFALTERIEEEQRPTITHRCALFCRYALAGEREKALSWMSPEAFATSSRDMGYSWWVACGYALLGDADSALDWLGNAVERGFLNHRYLAEVDPILAPLRGDSRFQALIARAKHLRAELEAGR